MAIILALRQAGYDVLMPFGENSRYDLVIERDRVFQRVQCKTGKLLGGAVRFRVASSYYHHPNPKTRTRHYVGHVDLFAVYCQAIGGVYLVPIDDLDGCEIEAALRVSASKNNQSRRVRPASRYEIGRVILATAGLRGPSGAGGSCA